jgi:HlyD family secretion protein
MLVYTKTDESDVGNIKAGTPVAFKVDAFPTESFRGVVRQVRMNPTTIQNVVTYDTIIEFANPDFKLFPGMTAYVTIPVETVSDVLKIPNTALRYKPPLSLEEIGALYARYGIEVDAAPRAEAATNPGSAQSPRTGATRAGSPAARREVVVWKLGPAGDTMEPVKLSLGITDHAYTQVAAVLKGALKEGDELIIRSIMPKAQSPAGIRR